VEGTEHAEVNRVWNALPKTIISPAFVEAVLRAGQLHGLVAVVGAERAPTSDEEWCREEVKKWVDGCRPKQPLVTRLQAALQEAVVPDGDRRSPFYPSKEQAADPRGRSAMDGVFTARVVELRGRHPDVLRELRPRRHPECGSPVGLHARHRAGAARDPGGASGVEGATTARPQPKRISRCHSRPEGTNRLKINKNLNTYPRHNPRLLLHTTSLEATVWGNRHTAKDPYEAEPFMAIKCTRIQERHFTAPSYTQNF